MSWIGTKLSAIGLDAGSKSIKAVQLKYVKGQPRIAASASIDRVSEQLDVPEIQRVADILYRQGFNGTRLHLAVPPTKLLTSILELPPRVAGSPFEQLARMEFAKNQKIDPAGFEMACWDLPQAQRATKTTSVMAVGCRYSDAEAILKPFDAVGFDVLSLDSGSCAVARACAGVLGGQSGVSAILDLGWRSASLVLLHDNTIIYDRPLGDGGVEQLYKDLSQSLGMKFDVIDVLIGEHARLGAGGAAQENQTEVSRAIDSHFSVMLKDLELSFSYAANQYASTGVNRLLLVGGGAGIPGLAEHWTKHLGIKVQVVRPSDVVAYADGVPSKADSAMVTALGLAMGVQ